MIKGVLENPLLPTAECLKVTSGIHNCANGVGLCVLEMVFLQVPLEVRLTAGKNWAAMSEVKGRTP